MLNNVNDNNIEINILVEVKHIDNILRILAMLSLFVVVLSFLALFDISVTSILESRRMSSQETLKISAINGIRVTSG